MRQSNYIHKLLEKGQLNESKYASTPMIIGKMISKHDSDELIDAIQYRIIIGAFHYCILI